MRARACFMVAGSIVFASQAAAQNPQTGPEMYRAWCAVCHGADGTGGEAARRLRTAPPDFTDCRFATAESDVDWEVVIRRGGPAVGLSAEMPSFEQLTAEQVAALIEQARSFCRERGWPHGNLNMPRALFATKAFPEDEVSLRPMISHGASTYARFSLTTTYARRIGRRAQLEMGVPIQTVGWVTGTVAGVGDVRFEGKQVLVSNARRRLILTIGTELSLPTGSRKWGFGEGTPVVEPYFAAATIWRRMYLQADVRGTIFTHHFPTEFYPHMAYHVSLHRDLRAPPASWIVGVEVDGLDRRLGVTPEVLRRVTRTGAVWAAVGVRLPVRPPFPYASDTYRWTGYVIWNYREPLWRRE